jgi:hypothetical protein
MDSLNAHFDDSNCPFCGRYERNTRGATHNRQKNIAEMSCQPEAGDDSLTTIFYGPFGAVCDDIRDPTDLHA